MIKKRVVLSCLLLVVLTIFSTGCSKDLLNLKEEKISLKLAGFPSEFDTYNLKIYIEEDDGRGIINVYEYKEIGSDEILNKSVVVNKNSDFMMVYLFRNEETAIDVPVYFWRIELEDGKKEYETLYWLNYDAYDYSEDYGISEQMAQTVESTVSEEIDFVEQPYYLYKLSNVKNQDIDIKVKSSTGEVLVGYSSEFASNYYNSYRTDYERFLYNWTDDNLYILIKPKEYEGNTKAIVNIKIVKSSYIGNKIINMVAGDTPNIIYALDDIGNLYYINPLNKSIENEYSLPGVSSPVAMSYSFIEQKLYILSEDSEVIVWNTVDNQITNNIPFLDDEYNVTERDIEVASMLGYIYVSSSEGITIIDINTEQEILTINNGNFGSIVIDENKKVLFGYDNNYGLCRYSIEADHTLTGLTYNPVNMWGDIELTPDGSKIIMYGYFSYSYKLNVYDADHIDNLLGDWSIEDVSDITLSLNGSLLYVSTKDNSLHVLDTENYSEIRKFKFSSAYGSEIITNSDGSVLIAAGISSYYGDDCKVYYFEDIQK